MRQVYSKCSLVRFQEMTLGSALTTRNCKNKEQQFSYIHWHILGNNLSHSVVVNSAFRLVLIMHGSPFLFTGMRCNHTLVTVLICCLFILVTSTTDLRKHVPFKKMKAYFFGNMGLHGLPSTQEGFWGSVQALEMLIPTRSSWQQATQTPFKGILIKQ